MRKQRSVWSTVSPERGQKQSIWKKNLRRCRQLICNDEGKLMQMKPSRAIFDEDGRVMDVIAGPFFICYAPIESETFMSLPDDLKEEMRKKFDLPEHYYRSDEGLMVLKYDPKDLDREQAR